MHAYITPVLGEARDIVVLDATNTLMQTAAKAPYPFLKNFRK